ncbi:hypothetical protein [Lentzea sp. NPDC004782]|uniref:hypothetical protein n=1 Tax=Lentzea sp. NPDC004782 TaxID=3154458 RepID=UPI0033BA399C
MSEPGPLSPPEQEEVVQNVCAALVGEAPAGWQQIRFEFYSTVGIDSARFEITAEDGSEVKLAPPMSAMDPLGDLRTEMYEEGKGSWFTARIVINPPGSYSVEYDYDNEPAFKPPLQADVYALDFEHFPRSEENTPEWLRAKLAEAAKTE